MVVENIFKIQFNFSMTPVWWGVWRERPADISSCVQVQVQASSSSAHRDLTVDCGLTVQANFPIRPHCAGPAACPGSHLQSLCWPLLGGLLTSWPQFEVVMAELLCGLTCCGGRAWAAVCRTGEVSVNDPETDRELPLLERHVITYWSTTSLLHSFVINKLSLSLSLYLSLLLSLPVLFTHKNCLSDLCRSA